MATPVQFGNEYEASYLLLSNDLFLSRYVLGEPTPKRDVPVDVSAYTMESSEPNPQTVTKTAWYEYQVGRPPSRMHFWVDGAASTGSIVVYHATDDSITNPAFADLVVAGQGADFWIDPLDDSFSSYYIQVGLKTGTGSDLVFHMESGDATEGDSFASAVSIAGLWGSAYSDTTSMTLETGEPVPSGISPTGSSWFSWVCPTPAPDGQTFSVRATGQSGKIGVGVYTGSSVSALTAVAQSSGLATGDVSVHWVPTAGTTYFVQVTTEFPRAVHTLYWLPDSKLVSPGAVPEGLIVKVYGTDGTTFLGELPKRRGSRFQEALNVVQSGEVTVSLSEPTVQANPSLLNTGNVVKFWLGAVCASAFRIQESEIKWISSGENTDVVKTVSGPTINVLMQDFIVHHDVSPRPDSPSVRYYSWASRPDEWYNAARWNHKIMTSSQANPPGEWSKKPSKRKRYKQPKKYPDKSAYWFWITNNTARNGGWRPPYSTAERYYRREFSLAHDTTARLFVTGDISVTVYCDGEEILTRSGDEKGYKSFTRLNVSLKAGAHTLAVHASTGSSVGKDGVDAFMLSLYRVGSDGDRAGLILRTNRGASGWKAYYGPSPQTWNRAMVMRNTFREAIARGNGSASVLAEGSGLGGLRFSATTDSNGVGWVDVFNQEVQIGASGYELQQQMSEGGGFDYWVNPDTLDPYAYNRRGADRSGSVAIVPGSSVMDWSYKTKDQIANVFLIHFDGGFVEMADDSSVALVGRRELYVELNSVKSAAAAVSLMRQVLRGVQGAIEKAGTPDIVSRKIDEDDSGGMIGVPGAFPFIDYNIGDVISGPGNDVSSYVRMRLLSLTCSEDATGRLTFDPELERV